MSQSHTRAKHWSHTGNVDRPLEEGAAPNPARPDAPRLSGPGGANHDRLQSVHLLQVIADPPGLVEARQARLPLRYHRGGG